MPINRSRGACVDTSLKCKTAEQTMNTLNVVALLLLLAAVNSQATTDCRAFLHPIPVKENDCEGNLYVWSCAGECHSEQVPNVVLASDRESV